MKVVLRKTLTGNILDIGGGGEGVIGRVYGEQVTAIDNRQSELDEAPAGPRKMLMGAALLEFSGETFDNVTAFYTMMYMDAATQKKAVCEAARVLRHGGRLCIWDADIASAYPDPFFAEPEIDADGTMLTPTYGIVREDAAQDADCFVVLGVSARLLLEERRDEDGHFWLCFYKP